MTYEEKIGTERFDAMVADFFANRYFDRGMRKWQGYYLSDHTAALKKQSKSEALVYPRCPSGSSGHSRNLATSLCRRPNSNSPA